MTRTDRFSLAIAALSVAATLIVLFLYLGERPLEGGDARATTHQDGPPAPAPARDVALPDDRIASTPIVSTRIAPRHVGPQENRPGDLRFLTGE